MLMNVSVERVGDWAEELGALTGGLGHLFARPESREVFADLIEGLLSDLGCKNGWTMAERATPHRIQKFLGEAGPMTCASKAPERPHARKRFK
ncbi:hypothetical protein GCM10010307_33980 [Streptomyces vastus]|uniref:IS701 family transposase n=2 Tax=Streptomyces vastus TaxID=285451 RepID=A0ABP6DB39_9ACTN